MELSGLVKLTLLYWGYWDMVGIVGLKGHLGLVGYGPIGTHLTCWTASWCIGNSELTWHAELPVDVYGIVGLTWHAEMPVNV